MTIERGVTESEGQMSDVLQLVRDRDVWQITPGVDADMWPIWREHSIASLDHAFYYSQSDKSREERAVQVKGYPKSRHNHSEYQAYLFQEELSKGDIIIAKHKIKGNIRLYGIGHVIAPYSLDHPAQLGKDHGAHEHQIGVSWIRFGDEGVGIDVDSTEIVGHAFGRLAEDTFEAAVTELFKREEVESSTLESQFNTVRTDEDSANELESDIPASPEGIDLNGLTFPNTDTLVDRILAALQTGKHIILTGPPGTGKTKLAKVIAATCSNQRYDIVTATADWSTFDTIGGYQPTADGQLQFIPGVFLECFYGGESSAPGKWLVVDEINRCDIDKAFGSLFTALTGETVSLPFRLPDGSRIIIDGDPDTDTSSSGPGRYVISEGWRMIATMNTYDKMTLYDLSYAFMRRFAFVTVPAPNGSEITESRVQRYIDEWEDIKNASEYNQDIAAIWSVVNGSESRKIGPALVRDIVQFVIATNGDFTGAITMYVLPQFEGLPTRQQVTVVQELTDLEAPQLDKGEIREFANDYLELTDRDFDKFGG